MFIAYNSAYASYGNSGGPRHSKFFQCTGSEQRLSQCRSYSNIYQRYYSTDVGIICSEAHCFDGQMRLMEGEKSGRVDLKCATIRDGALLHGGDGWTETNTGRLQSSWIWKI
jgi:hypothetical protein